MSQEEEIRFRLQKFMELNEQIEEAQSVVQTVTKEPSPDLEKPKEKPIKKIRFKTEEPSPKVEKPKEKPIVLDVTKISKYRIFNDNSLALETLYQFFSSFGQVLDYYIPKVYGTDEDKSFAYFTIMRDDGAIVKNGWYAIDEQRLRIQRETSNNHAGKSSTCIVVSASPKLMAKLTVDMLRANFKQFGKIKDIRIPKDTHKKTLLHCAFVEYKTSDAVKKAIRKLIELFN